MSPTLNLKSAKPVYRFGDFELRCESGELFRNGVRVRVQEQSLQVLLSLLETSGAVVSRDHLRERLWADGTYVDFEHSLNAAVKRLRAALADDATDPRYIETLPRRGYRLLVEVSSEPATPNPLVEPQPEPNGAPRSRRLLVWGTAVGLGLIFVVGLIAVAVGLRRRPDRRRSDPLQNGRVSQNSDARELYLQSLSYKAEYPTNAQGLKLLERSIVLDPGSARTWYELARRYNAEYLYTTRGPSVFLQAREANRRALQLAPDFLPARVQKVSLDVEAGQALTAYDDALLLVRAYPNDARAHFALFYTLQSGGMFEEAAQECETALKLDPSNAAYRPCGLVFELLGRYDRASVFLDLDPLSSPTRFRRMELAILKNDRKRALEFAQSILVDHGPDDFPQFHMVKEYLAGRPPTELRELSQKAEAISDKIPIPASLFVEARYQSLAGQPEAAARLLRRAIANGYCAYPAMDSDPLLASVRRIPEYQDLRRAGMQCNQNFRAHMRE